MYIYAFNRYTLIRVRIRLLYTVSLTHAMRRILRVYYAFPTRPLCPYFRFCGAHVALAALALDCARLVGCNIAAMEENDYDEAMSMRRTHAHSP